MYIIHVIQDGTGHKPIRSPVFMCGSTRAATLIGNQLPLFNMTKSEEEKEP
jgi:hypothetical protein